MSASTSDVDVPESFDDLLEKIHVPNFSPVEPPAVNDPEVLEWNGIMQSILGRLREQVRSQTPENRWRSTCYRQSSALVEQRHMGP